MTQKDKRDYLNTLIEAIVAHDEDFFYDAGGAVCWEVETNRVICCTPAWEYVSDERLELPDDGVIYITFDWAEDDRDRTVHIDFYTSYDNIALDVSDYMYILKQFNEEYLK